MEFNDRITKVIEYSEMSPAEFAEEIGVQRSSISHIISGRNKPSLDFITKIKSKFPDIEWNWLITGSGEMLIKEDAAAPTEPEVSKPEEKPAKKSLPDLFSLINDEQFGYTETEDNVQKNTARESDIHAPIPMQNKTAHSQPLENILNTQDNQNKKIRRIVFFYDDGTFETYEN